MPTSYSIPLQEINFDEISASGVKLKMARADNIHKLASGNKIYKLYPILEFAKANNYQQILSFGGAFSNHIHALALMAQQQNIEAIGIIRGEPEYAENPTLSDARNAGMTLEFVNREDYKQRNDQVYLAQLQSRFPKALIIPEGGSSQLAISGCTQMARDINLNDSSDILAIASGTGATASGLICGLAENQRLIAYSVLKDKSLGSRIDNFIDAENNPNQSRYSIEAADYDGYAKFDQHLLAFILDWLQQTGILLDPIYTSKMCRRVIQHINMGKFSNGQAITLIHSGGLQGWRGMQKRVISTAGEQAWQKISDYLSTKVI